MNRVHKLITSFAAFAAFTVCASPALARPAYSCKRDKVVDVPMQVTATVVGGRVELQANTRATIAPMLAAGLSPLIRSATEPTCSCSPSTLTIADRPTAPEREP